MNKFFMGNVRFVHILFGCFSSFCSSGESIWPFSPASMRTGETSWLGRILRAIGRANEVLYAHRAKQVRKRRTFMDLCRSIAYIGLLAMVVVIVITGLILMGAGYHAGLTAIAYKILRPIERLMGGLAVVRYIHHVFTWFFILFIVVHIYMAFWYDAILKKGTVSSMISGNIFKKDKKVTSFKLSKYKITGKGRRNRSPLFWLCRINIIFKLKMISRRQGEGAGNVYVNTLRTPTTQTTKIAL